MYSDPQSVTVNAVAQSMARTGVGPASGTFTKDDGSYKLSISHQTGRRVRRQLRLDFSKIATDPLIPTQNAPYSMSVYVVVDQPKVGFTNAELKQVVDGLTAYLTASSGAKVTQLLAGEI
jgi:hypothetical protein